MQSKKAASPAVLIQCLHSMDKEWSLSCKQQRLSSLSAGLPDIQKFALTQWKLSRQRTQVLGEKRDKLSILSRFFT
jgi:hypothetical protein